MAGESSGAVAKLPGALTLIIQCLQSARDVVVFVQALPPASQDAPLVAAKELLTRPGPLAYMWPALLLDDIDCDDDSIVALYHAALPALVSVCAKELDLFGRVMRPRGNVNTPAQGFIEFVSQWPLKMTHVDSRWVQEVGSVAFCTLLRRCTRLETLELSAGEHAQDIVAAMTTPVHRVHTLLLSGSSPAMNWTSLLQPWLSSGHARHVSFNKVPTTDCSGLAHALATTKSLRGLSIVTNDDILCELLEWKLPLHHITELKLATPNAKAMRQLMQLVDVTKLTSLALHCQYEISDVLGLIPRMTTLRHLSLQWVHFGVTDTSQWPDLESVAFDDIDCDDDGTVALYHAALPTLASVRAEKVELFQRFMRPRASTPAQGLINFSSQWPLKITHVKERWLGAIGDAAYCSVLRRCTRLETIEVDATANTSDILAAITTPAHRVQSLFVTASVCARAMNWALLLQPWLSSGHARHVSFEHIRTPDCNALAHALATTKTLQGLRIGDNDELLGELLRWNLPLHHITELELTMSYSMMQLMQLIDVAKLISLTLHCDYEISALEVVGRVPRMSALRHLSLCRVHLNEVDMSQWPHLESLSLTRVKFTHAAFDAILAYLNNVQGLQRLTFGRVSDGRFAAWSRTLGRLINSGLVAVRLTGCFLDGYNAERLAFALRQRRTASPLRLDLCYDEFGFEAVRVLVEALAVCTNVSVQMEPGRYAIFDLYHDAVRPFLEAVRTTRGPNVAEIAVVYHLEANAMTTIFT
ncbi:hypothetical protein SPRG_07645 [Saprolegnia parasitica CBS 223.65]|uniref:Uncharacterized protein n=1 Tax=Saprolegnia parasitica (strain CBS 223.65) TaxID=695850 RepID=A0A067CK57_SAPPC|nr:hypothetical protein SPRG_07645 [Saprolegnia parasitica CBS 223.65]KDO26931.1 hypothetical protein SPRG_07645 [Saprolegnia parasitica CBS 223.65]|eukprot:XP_012202313.1 hypothetical protein SPRG_07645 [Saprolegnia parasitica CBS 223.65]